eukprot:4628011-Pleurochrysis_carterae.AAC.1
MKVQLRWLHVQIGTRRAVRATRLRGTIILLLSHTYSELWVQSPRYSWWPAMDGKVRALRSIPFCDVTGALAPQCDALQVPRQLLGTL